MKLICYAWTRNGETRFENAIIDDVSAWLVEAYTMPALVKERFRLVSVIPLEPGEAEALDREGLF